MAANPIPNSVLGYGLLGAVPFVAPPLLSLSSPAHAGFLGIISVAYGALIVSFLGGARWGREVARPAPRAGVITLAMLPTIAALLLLLAPMMVAMAPARQLKLMAVLLVVHFLWDLRARGLPPWYPRLRAILTFVAVAGLMAMAGIADKASEAGGATMV